MSGGIIDTSNCHYKAGSWQLKYCQSQADRMPPNLTPEVYFNSFVGNEDPGTVLRLTNALLAPLEFLPGTHEHYANEAFLLASHIVEHVSGLPLPDYLKKYIFEPLGFTRTYLDVSWGLDGLYRYTVPYPAYIAHMAPLNVSMPAYDDPYIGASTYTTGNIDAKSLSPAERAAIGAGQPGRWAKTARLPQTSNFGSDFTKSSGSGAIMSTPREVALWLRNLLTRPDRLGLSPTMVKRMLTTSTRIPVPEGDTAFGSMAAAVKALNGSLHYAQGVVVVVDKTCRLGVSGLYYKGSLGGFDATYYVALHPTDPAQDVMVFVLTTTSPLYFAEFGPLLKRTNSSAASDGNSSDSDAGSTTGCTLVLPYQPPHPVPRYLCDANEVMMAQGPPSLLLDKALMELTGRGIMGLISPWVQAASPTEGR